MRMPQSTLGGRRKPSGRTGRGRNLGGRGDRDEKGEHDHLLWREDRTEALRASRKNGNRQPWEVGGWGYPPECTRNMGGERLSGPKVRDLR